MPNRVLIILAVALSTQALADTRTALSDALSHARDARAAADQASSACRKKVYRKVEDLMDRLSDVKARPDEKGLANARREARSLSDLAADSCRSSDARHISKPLGRVVASLDVAADALPRPAPAEKKSGNVLDVAVNFGSGLFGGGSSQTTSSSSTSVTTRREETINGREVDDEDEAPAPKRQRGGHGTAAFGATCSRNSDCASNTCFTGAGDLGYCTKMCDSFSDCPSFWDCKRVANAPQTICQQGN